MYACMYTRVYAYMYIYRYVYVHKYFYLVLTMCRPVYNGGMHVCTMPAEGISFSLEMEF